MRKRQVSPQPIESSIDWSRLKPLSSTLEVANFTGIKEKRLREWRSQKSHLSPPFIRIGRSVLYERDALRRWYENTVLEQLRRQGVVA